LKETLLLTKILFKNSLNKNTNIEKGSFKAIVKKLILFLAIAYIACVLGFLSKEMVESLRKVNQPQVFVSLCLLVSIIMTVYSSILSALNVLYFSKDIEFLLPLPISPLKIVVAKFNVMIISNYIVEFIAFSVPFAVYGIIMNVSPMFYVMSVLVFLFLPIIPTLIGVIFTVILMNCTNFLKNKDIVQYITVFVTFAFVIAIQIYTMKTSEITDFMLANKLIEINGLTSVVANYFIILKQAIISITEFEEISAIKNIAYLIGEGITAYLLVAILVSKTYIRSATNIVSSKVLKAKANLNNVSKKTVGKAYIDKEFKILFRNPIFFLNAIMPIILMPIIISIPIFTSNNNLENSEEALALIDVIEENMENPIGLAICISIINVLYLFNIISVTSISRDGENAIFMKYIPVELHKQCRYKAVPSFIFNLFPLIYVIVGIKLIFSDISYIFIGEVVLVSLLINVFISYVTIIIDILRPKIHWNAEYAVVKQNLNVLFGMIFIIITSIIIFEICACFENIHIVVALLSAILIFTTVCYDKFLKENSVNIFKKIF
jgi:ABC-2 type transport system permease protein